MKEYIIKVDESKTDFMGGMRVTEKKELVRCKECKKRDGCDVFAWNGTWPGDDWFCADGERR